MKTYSFSLYLDEMEGLIEQIIEEKQGDRYLLVELGQFGVLSSNDTGSQTVLKRLMLARKAQMNDWIVVVSASGGYLHHSSVAANTLRPQANLSKINQLVKLMSTNRTQHMLTSFSTKEAEFLAKQNNVPDEIISRLWELTCTQSKASFPLYGSS